MGSKRCSISCIHTVSPDTSTFRQDNTLQQSIVNCLRIVPKARSTEPLKLGKSIKPATASATNSEKTIIPKTQNSELPSKTRAWVSKIRNVYGSPRKRELPHMFPFHGPSTLAGMKLLSPRTSVRTAASLSLLPSPRTESTGLQLIEQELA